MRKRKWIMPAVIVIVLIVVLAVGLWIMAAKGFGVTVARYLLADNGCHMMITDDRYPVCISKDEIPSGLRNGDRIFVLHDGIQETYPGMTKAFILIRLQRGDISLIPQSVLDELTDLGYWTGSDSQTNTADNYEFSISFANYSTSDKIFSAALNADKMAISSVHHLPILKFENLDALLQFKAQFSEEFSMDRPYNDVPSFEQITASMDEAYFEKYTVFLIYVPANSGSLRYGVNSIFCDGESLCIHVEQTNHPEAATLDLVGWFIAVSIDKDAVSGCTEFDADLNNIS